jgi:hypothetical protein
MQSRRPAARLLQRTHPTAARLAAHVRRAGAPHCAACPSPPRSRGRHCRRRKGGDCKDAAAPCALRRAAAVDPAGAAECAQGARRPQECEQKTAAARVLPHTACLQRRLGRHRAALLVAGRCAGTHLHGGPWPPGGQGPLRERRAAAGGGVAPGSGSGLVCGPKAGQKKSKQWRNMACHLWSIAAARPRGETLRAAPEPAASAAPVRVTDVAEDADLAPVWADAQAEAAAHYQRTAALRQLAALARAGLTSDPGGQGQRRQGVGPGTIAAAWLRH